MLVSSIGHLKKCCYVELANRSLRRMVHFTENSKDYLRRQSVFMDTVLWKSQYLQKSVFSKLFGLIVTHFVFLMFIITLVNDVEL